jgi:hypothetical protein
MIPADDPTPEEFMDDAALAPKPPTMGNGKAKVIRKKLHEGEVIEAKVEPERVTQETTKLMKVVSITRKPSGRIAQIEMRLKAGIVDLEIDEATARAIASVFDD